MTNRTVELILAMRDQATAVWNKFESGIRGKGQRMFKWMTSNWLTIGASIAGAFYLAAHALEKIERLAKKTQKAIKGQGGDAANASKQLQELVVWLEKIRKIADEALIRFGLYLMGMGKSIATFFAILFSALLTPLARIEKGLNDLGISSSKTFQRMVDHGTQLAIKYGKEATDAFKAAFAASDKLISSHESLREKVERLRKELDDLDPTTSAYIQKYREWKKASDELEKAIQRATLMAQHGHKLALPPLEIHVKQVGKLQNRYKMMMENISNVQTKIKPERISGAFGKAIDKAQENLQVFDAGWQFTFDNMSEAASRSANSIHEFFRGNTQGIGNLFKDMVKGILDQLAYLAARMAAMAIFSQLLSFAGAGPFRAIFGMMSGLKLHQGGIITAHNGALLGSTYQGKKEVMVKGFEGEEVLPPWNPRHIQNQGQGTNVSVSFTINAIDSRDVYRQFRRPRYRTALLGSIGDAVRKGLS